MNGFSLGSLSVSGAAVEGVVRCLLVACLFVLVRFLGLGLLEAAFRPFEARARREGESSVARLHTLAAISRSLFSYSLLFIAAVTVLSLLGVNVMAILAGAGVAGLALSFGAQRLVRDVLTGFFLLLEDQFRVGEMVTLVGGPGLPQFQGTVLDVGLRVTRLRDLSGKLVSLGNGEVVAVINHSRGPI
ncbi:MAG: mechanosensitive ion channel, partial [Armatimonadetes bacterium]|nr:mechanosensitive ion channel [Armatimonadota bacterium]